MLNASALKKCRRILNEAELAIVVLDGSAPLTEEDFGNIGIS